MKKLASAQLDETDSPTYNSFEADENCEVYFQNLDQSESKCIPSSKSIKAGQDNLPSMICGDGTSGTSEVIVSVLLHTPTLGLQMLMCFSLFGQKTHACY